VVWNELIGECVVCSLTQEEEMNVTVLDLNCRLNVTFSWQPHTAI